MSMIQELRTQMDGVNREMIRLFCRRMELSAEIAVCKQRDGRPVYDPARERDILETVSAQAGEDLADYARVLFQTLFDLSKSYQAEILASPAAAAGAKGEEHDG